jgi:hypothetical protein
MGNIQVVKDVIKMYGYIIKHKLESFASNKLLSLYINSPRDYLTAEIIIGSIALSKNARVTREKIDELSQKLADSQEK